MNLYPDNIEEIKSNLMSDSHIVQLQSIAEVKMICDIIPKYIEEFSPIISILTNSGHPWIKKEARNCLTKFNKILSSSIVHTSTITSIEEYLNLLISLVKQYHIERITELFLQIDAQKREDWSLKEKLRFLMGKKNKNFLETVFSDTEISFIAGRFGLKYSGEKKNLEIINLEIYKILGFNVSRGDYLEL